MSYLNIYKNKEYIQLIIQILLLCPDHGVPQRPPSSPNLYAKAKSLYSFKLELGPSVCPIQPYEWRLYSLGRVEYLS